MQERSPLAVLLLPFVTLGIYSIYWLVTTKTEMLGKRADIPTAWLLIVPIANIWWYWKYSEGVEKVTNSQTSAGVAFLMLFLLPIVGPAILQSYFNKVAT